MHTLPEGLAYDPGDGRVRRTIWEWNQLSAERVKDPDGFVRGPDLMHRLFTIEEYVRGKRGSTMERRPEWFEGATF